MVGSKDPILSKIHPATTYFLEFCFLFGMKLDVEASETFQGKWKENRKEGDQTPQEAPTQKILDCECNFNTGFTSAQLLAAIKQRVSWTLDDLGHECVPGTYHHAEWDCSCKMLFNATNNFCK